MLRRRGDGHHLGAVGTADLVGYIHIVLPVQLPLVTSVFRGLDAQHLLRVLLVGHQHVDVRHDLSHAGLGLFLRPQVLAVVQIAADGQPHLLGLLAGLDAHLGDGLAQGGGDARHVEIGSPGKDGVPVKVLIGAGGDGGVLPVVDDLGGALGGPLLA